jgi:hypothetical protein
MIENDHGLEEYSMKNKGFITSEFWDPPDNYPVEYGIYGTTGV